MAEQAHFSSDESAQSGAAWPMPQQSDRRQGERRRYNRRVRDNGSPPYFEVFERIAKALEEIHQDLRSQATDRE